MANKFTKHTLITITARALAVASGLGISIVMARTLGPEGKGIYSLAILLPGVLVTFTNLGVNPATVFYVARKKYLAKEIFGNNIILTILISAFTILLGLIIIYSSGTRLFPGVNRSYLFLALCIVPLLLFFDFISHILVGLQKLNLYNFIYLLQSLLFFILVGVLLLVFHFGIKATILAQIMAFLLAGIVLYFYVNKETEGVYFRPNKGYLKEVSYFGLKAHLGGVIYFLHLRSNLFFINIFLNPVAVGFYSIAVGIAEGMWLISRSVGTVLLPKVAAETDPESLKRFTPIVCRNVLLLAVSLAILLFILSQWLVVWLYSEAFLESIQPLRILLVGAAAYCGHGVLVHDLMARGKPLLVSYIAGISLIFNIILNVLWIPMWGIAGAAWATTISYSVMFACTVYMYGRISGNKISEIIFPRKSDFQYYYNALLMVKSLKF